MKKRSLCILVLILCLSMLTGCCFHKEWYAATCTAPKTCVECGKTEGEPLGHFWAHATCETPKTCTACYLTEGSSLGHRWLDATTEAPKTCTTCALTEGERIITDPRFTTAATRDLQGKWTADLSVPSEMFGIEGFDGALELKIFIDLGNDGTMNMGYAAVNADDFSSALIGYATENAYAEMEAAGFTREETDAAMMNVYGMNVAEYAASVVSGIDLSAIFGALDINGVYYVEEDQFYSGVSWDMELEPSLFMLNGDTLILEDELAGLSEETLTFTRVAE